MPQTEINTLKFSVSILKVWLLSFLTHYILFRVKEESTSDIQFPAVAEEESGETEQVIHLEGEIMAYMFQSLFLCSANCLHFMDGNLLIRTSGFLINITIPVIDETFLWLETTTWPMGGYQFVPRLHELSLISFTRWHFVVLIKLNWKISHRW